MWQVTELATLLFLVFLSGAPAHAQPAQQMVYQSVYAEQLNVAPCYRVLSADGQFGCQGNGHNVGTLISAATQEELLQFTGEKPPPQPVVLVLSPVLLTRQTLEGLSKASAHIAGILVPYLSSRQQGWQVFRGERWFLSAQSTGASDDFPCPNCEFRESVTSVNGTFAWNPTGRRLLNIAVPFPIIALDESEMNTLNQLDQALLYNQQSQGYGDVYPFLGAELNSFMYAAIDSETCLRRSATQTRHFCYPLGGMSVISSPSLPQEFASEPKKPIVWLVSQMDSRSMFPDFTLGMNAHVSNVITLLLVADALSKQNLTQLPGQLVYGLFNAETWGNAGSSRFLRDLTDFKCKKNGDKASKCDIPYFLNTDFKSIQFDQSMALLEVNQLIPATTSSNVNIYAHSNGPSSQNQILANVLKSVPQSPLANVSININDVTGSSLGLPPSSAISFVQKKPTLPHLVLTNHEKEFSNLFYSNLGDSSIAFNDPRFSNALCQTASVVASSVFRLLSAGSLDPTVLQAVTVNGEPQVNCTLALELWTCFGRNFSCPLVRRYLPEYGVNRTMTYAGVFKFDTLLSAFPWFLMRFMSEKTARSLVDNNENAKAQCVTRPASCVVSDGKQCTGQACVTTFTRTHDAYGLGLEYDYDLDRFRVVDPKKPTWTVSNSDPASLRIFVLDNPRAQSGQLAGAIIFTVLFYISCWFLKRRIKEKVQFV